MSRFARLGRALVIALAFAFAVVVVLSYRKPGARTEGAKDPVAETLLAEANGARDRMRFRDFRYDETRESEGRYRVTASEAVRFEEKGGRLFRLKDVVFESEESKEGRRVSIRAPRAELAEGSRAFRVFDGVEVAGEEMRVTGASFRYDPLRRLLASEGPVNATREGLVANASSGSIDTRDGVLVLNGDARLRGRGDGGRPVELRAPKVLVGRDGRLEASGGAVLKTDRFVLRGQTFTREATPQGSHLRATRDARLLVPPEHGQPPAVLSVTGDVLDLSVDADGRPAAFEAGAPGVARLDLAPTAASGARRAEAPRFLGRFESGRLAELNVPENLRTAESGRTGGPPGSGLRTFAAGFARLTFGLGLALETGTFEKGVTATDGTRAAIKAPHATLRGRDETAVFSGEPGVPADYRDERGAIRARTLSWSRRDERVDAAGDVKATYAGGADRRIGLLGSDSTAPFFSESDTLRLTGTTSKVLLTGSVRAWQNENVLRCGTLELDDKEKSLRAERNVRAFFRRETAPPRGKTGKGSAPAGSETVNAASDVLTHREADRFVRLEGHATITSGPWTMNSDVTDIRLTETRAIEYAEARGAVVVEDRAEHRRGEGTKAIWRPVTEAVTLEGSPATALDGRGNKSTGAALTFRQGRSQVDVETGGKVPTETVLRPEGLVSDGKPLLEGRGLRKSYRGRTVVNDVSVRVEGGEVVGLLGPNGAGKTTTFSMTVGLVTPDAGAVLLDSEDVTTLPMFRRARRGLGYLPQEPSIFRRMTALENLLAILETLPGDRGAREETAHGLLDRFKLSHLAHSVADTLSGGERRRLEIARALTLSPRFILLDEPFAGIDPITVLDLQQVIRDLAAAGIGILITDHNVRDTLAIVNRGYIIHSGTIFRTGSPETLSADPEVRRVYLGETFRLA